ncbi:hypothetical protein RvY_01357 [Ramazzottius varieornatus]|uniref:Uncharacterized protein n=1 Tax=Ramazzottius varieornatus TaxID=947166 RepID=A0A1D1UN64_RAMVA|nr:hypothetical protein RvY_01357 [Ramazzottius varieornatus]
MSVEEVNKLVKDDVFVLRDEIFRSRKPEAFGSTETRVVDVDSGDGLDFVCCSESRVVWKLYRCTTDPLNRYVQKCGVKGSQPRITGFLEMHKLQFVATQEVPKQACFKTKVKSQFPMSAGALPTLTLINQLKSLVTHCKQGGISCQLKTTLKQQCDTRWNTHVKMLSSGVAAYDELEVILANRNELQLLPTSRQRIQEIHDLFEPVSDITVQLSASKTPTLHLVAPAYIEPIRHFKEYTPSDFADVRVFQKHTETVLTKKLQIDEIHKRAVFLDPSMKHFNFLKAKEQVALLTRGIAEVQKVPMPEKIGAPTAEEFAPYQYDYKHSMESFDLPAVNVAAKKPPKFNPKAMEKYSMDKPIENEVQKIDEDSVEGSTKSRRPTKADSGILPRKEPTA